MLPPVGTQQEQTLDYFNRSADEWKHKAKGVADNVNVIAERNDYVLSVAGKPGRSLDVGCGTGELVNALAGAGWNATGIDFAPEMIEICKQRASTSATFVTASIFDYAPLEKFDLISANGFIEYISRESFVTFANRMAGWLNEGGSLVLGSRNRHFNLFSLNDYTQKEIDLGTVNRLLSESMIISNSKTVEECILRLLELNEPLPAFDSHPDTGIGVSVRHQYTPGELLRVLHDAGLTTVDIAPIHYHAGGSRLTAEDKAAHVAFATYIYNHKSHYHIPFSSSFMVRASKL